MPTLRCDTIVLAGKKITKNSKVVCCHLLEGFVLWCVSAAVTGPRASPRPFSFVWLEISPHGNDHLRVLNKQEVWSCANAQKCKANPALAFDCSCKWHQWQFSPPAQRKHPAWCLQQLWDHPTLSPLLPPLLCISKKRLPPHPLPSTQQICPLTVFRTLRAAIQPDRRLSDLKRNKRSLFCLPAGVYCVLLLQCHGVFVTVNSNRRWKTRPTVWNLK